MSRGGVHRSTTNRFEAFAHIVKGNFGPGCLALPAAFARVGPFVGLVLLAIITIQGTYSMSLLVWCKRRLNSPRVVTFTDVGRATFGAAGARFIDALIVAQQLGVCCVFIALVATNLRAARPSMPFALCVLPVYVLALLFSMIPSIHALTPLSMVANTLMFLACATAVGAALHEITNGQHASGSALWPDSAGDVALCLGALFYAYEGIALVLPVETATRVLDARAGVEKLSAEREGAVELMAMGAHGAALAPPGPPPGPSHAIASASPAPEDAQAAGLDGAGPAQGARDASPPRGAALSFEAAPASAQPEGADGAAQPTAWPAAAAGAAADDGHRPTGTVTSESAFEGEWADASRDDFTPVLVAANVSLSCMFGALGAACAVAFPEVRSGSITAFLERRHHAGHLFGAVNTVVASAVLLTFPLQLQPALEVIENRSAPPAAHHGSSSGVGGSSSSSVPAPATASDDLEGAAAPRGRFSRARQLHAFVRTRALTTTMCALVVLALPRLDLLIALLGAMCQAVMAGTPFVFSLKLHSMGELRLPRWLVPVNVVCAVFCALTTVFGTTRAVIDIIEVTLSRIG